MSVEHLWLAPILAVLGMVALGLIVKAMIYLWAEGDSMTRDDEMANRPYTDD
jgi:hypothetical protein